MKLKQFRGIRIIWKWFALEYKSYKTAVLAVLKECKHEFCEGVGTLIVAEVQSITPVGVRTANPGNLKKSIESEVLPNNDGVNIGVTPNAKYGYYVHEGIGQPAQPFLENGSNSSIPKMTNVAERIYQSKLGGE